MGSFFPSVRLYSSNPWNCHACIPNSFPTGSVIVPFCGSAFGVLKGNPKKGATMEPMGYHQIVTTVTVAGLLCSDVC